MLASSEDFFTFMFVSMAFAGVMAFLHYRHTERRQCLQMVELALRDPKLDAATREKLISALEERGTLGGAWRTWFRENLTPRRVFAGIAWMLMVAGGLTVAFGRGFDAVPGIVMMSIGLGVLALPIVVREVERSAVRR
ncbi:MAG TPA: hypothetical protein VK081_11050 [Planctomycetota bacterium]|nr:hypothetical protein [Planctomycetota bacterium]